MNKTLSVLLSLALLVAASPLAAAETGADDLVCVNVTECVGELYEFVLVVYWTVWGLIGPIRI